MAKCKKCGAKKKSPYDILDTCEKCTPIPLRCWHKTKDGKTIDKAYEGCIHYFRNDPITGNDTCHCFSIDGECCEESKGIPCQLLAWSRIGYKSLKIQYVYFKHSLEDEQKIIEQIKAGVI